MALRLLERWNPVVRLRLERLEDRLAPSATDLGVATDFNLFVFDDYTAMWTDTEGRVAVGDDAALTGYGVGGWLSNSNGTRDDLIVGGDLVYHQGQVFNGNAVYGGMGDIQNVGFPNGSSRQESGVIDFASVKAELLQKSTDWSAIAANGTTDVNSGTLRLVGTDSALNVFTVTAEQLATATGLSITAPAGSTVLINVSGTMATMQNFAIWINGTDRNHVLFNFWGAKSLTLQNIGIEGSILAPQAKVCFNNGLFAGTLVADCVTGNGQFNHYPPMLDIDMPAPPAPPPPPPPSTGSLDGRVFQGEGRARIGIPDIPVNLTGTAPNGNPLMGWSTQTDVDGFYHFESLPAGSYAVSLDLGNTPFEVLDENQGSAPAVLGPVDGTISDIFLGPGDPLFGFDFQLFQPG